MSPEACGYWKVDGGCLDKTRKGIVRTEEHKVITE